MKGRSTVMVKQCNETASVWRGFVHSSKKKTVKVLRWLISRTPYFVSWSRAKSVVRAVFLRYFPEINIELMLEVTCT